MVDSPKVFLVIVIAIIICLSAISFATKSYLSAKEKDSSLLITVGSPGANATSLVTPKTTTQTSGTKTSTTKPAYQGNTVITPNVKTDYTIEYLSSGFSPKTLKIKVGQSVRFINRTNTSMRVATYQNPGGVQESGFSQSSTVGYGGTFDFSFTKSGVFVYYNISDKTKVGAISVE